MAGDSLGYRGFVSRYHLGEVDVQYQDVASPAAGSNTSYLIQGQGVQVIAARATFTPDANVASRVVSLDYLDARGNVRVRNLAAVTLAASSGAQTFEWNAAWAVSEWNTGTPVVVPVLDCILDIGMSVRFTATSIQTGDTFTALSLVLLTLPSGPSGD